MVGQKNTRTYEGIVRYPGIYKMRGRVPLAGSLADFRTVLKILNPIRENSEAYSSNSRKKLEPQI
jgi:hypothetical protein